MGDDIVALVAIITMFGLPVAGWVIVRALGHRERMEMIRNGIVPPAGRRQQRWSEPPPQPPGFRAPGPPGYDDSRRRNRCGEPLSPGAALRKGIGLTMIGIALTIGLSFIGYNNGSISPGPWLLGGLIPMFVGLSQVLTAILSGATLGGTQTYAGPPPAPDYAPGPQATSPAPPAYGSSYTYRPGDTQELRPPSSPLDPRTRP